MDNELKKINETVRQELANYLGVEAGDIEDESILAEDLHMKATDLTDFLEVLTRMGMDTSSIDLTTIETFSDLIEALAEHQ